MEIEKYIFVKPELKTIYSKIVNNKKFQSFLKKIGALVTIDDYYESYDLPTKTVKEEIKALNKVREINKETILNLVSVLLDNNDKIVNLSVNELVNSNFLVEDIKNALGFSIDDDFDYSIIKEFYYIYKFSYVDNFFQNNWEKFVPEVDFNEINNNNVAKSFVEALMIEFDKINNIINNVKDFKNYKKIPYEYINYLTQLLGFEQLHLSLTEDYEEELRTIAANIIDVYRIRGTASSFELLFNFLGFNVEIVQYYFDRRYKFSSINENKEIQENNPNSYRFYLTKNNPADNIADNFPIVETVKDSDFVKPLSFESFPTLVDRYGIDCVLGYSDIYIYKGDYETDKNGNKKIIRDNFLDENGKRIRAGDENIYTGPIYSYFLTNVIDIKPTLVVGDKNFTVKQLNILSKLLKFLVPEFWKKHFVVTVNFGEGNDKEKLTVNGDRKLDSNREMIDGFRILDDEDWIYNEGNEYFFDRDKTHILEDITNEYYKKQEKEYKQTLIDEKKYRVLQLYTNVKGETGRYIKIDEDTILQEISANEAGQLAKNGNIVSTISEIIKLSSEQNTEEQNNEGEENKEKLRYFRILNKNGEDEDIRYNPRYLYTNSIGEFGDRRGFFESFTKKLGDNKINIINSTKGMGALMKLNENNNEQVYKFWKRDSQDGKNGNWWYPPKKETTKKASTALYNNYLNRKELYYPSDNTLDPNKSYNKVELSNFNSMEGQSLRKLLLTTNEDTKKELINLSNYSGDTFVECLKNKTDENVITSVITNCVWEPVIFETKIKNGETEKTVEKKLIVARNIEDVKKIKSSNFSNDCLLAGTLSKFVKKHNVINYDYINNQLMTGVMSGDDKKYFDITKCKFYKKDLLNDKFKPTKKIQVYSVCYEDGSQNALTELLKETFDIGGYYLQREELNNICYYVAYRLNEPKTTNYGSQKLMAYRYKLTNIKYKATSKLYNENSLDKTTIKEYDELISKKISDMNISELNKYLKIKNDKGKISILSKQTTEYRLFSYDKTSNEAISYTVFNDNAAIKPSNSIEMKGGYIDDNNEYSDLENGQKSIFGENSTCGDFYFNFDAIQDRSTTKFNKDANIENILSKRTKKIIAKRHNCLADGLYYYNGNVYKPVFNNISVFNNNEKVFICDKVVDGVATEKKYFGIENTSDVIDNKLTPGTEGTNYMLDNNGNLVPSQKIKTIQYNFVKKEVGEDTTNLFVFGLKPVLLKGKIVNTEVVEDDAKKVITALYDYDNKYNGISEEEDTDNYILNNNKRIIKWDIVKGIYKRNQQISDAHEFSNKRITRPIRDLVNQTFDDYTDAFDDRKRLIENRTNFLRNIFEEMLGNTASLNIITNNLQEEGDING